MNDKDVEERRQNIIIYRVPESGGDQDERKQHDTSFVQSLCNEALQIDVRDGDIAEIFRLARKVNTVTIRPLLVSFKSADIQLDIMQRLARLKNAEQKFKRISIAHDLKPDQRSATAD